MKKLTKYQEHLNAMGHCDLIKLREISRYKGTSETAQNAKDFLINNGWVSKTFIRENDIQDKALSTIEHVCIVKSEFCIEFHLRKYKEYNAYDEIKIITEFKEEDNA